MPATTDDGTGLAQLKNCEILKHWKEVLFCVDVAIDCYFEYEFEI